MKELSPGQRAERPRQIGGAFMGIPARLGIVTLGVADLRRSEAFYQALGWERCASSIDGEIAWFRTTGAYLGLFPYRDLAADAQIESPERGTFDGVTLAMCVDTEDALHEAIATATDAGATVVRAPSSTVFGATSYFRDPDGYVWEVAYNPGFMTTEGGLSIP
jgi:predicted lactoylglutathione lyase